MSNDNDNFDPWGQPKEPKKPKKNGQGQNHPQNSGYGSKKPDNEFEDIIKKFKKGRDDIFSGKGGNRKGWALITIVALALYLISGSMFIVATGEQAVILRFGKFHRTELEGLNFKLPPPFEKVYIEAVEKVREVNIGQSIDESLMVTGDENIVDVQFTVQWKIGELKDYLFEVRDSGNSVKSTAESAMREVIANIPIAQALGEGAGRTKIAEETKTLLQDMLTSYGTGIDVIGIQLKKIEVPAQVIDAQIDVQNAKTEQQKVKNQAEAYSNDIIPRARGEAAKAIQEAEAYKIATVERAEGEASRFLAVYKQYRVAKDVTKKRIYLETMQDVLSGMDKLIMDSSGNVLPYLPLPEMKKSANKSGGKQ